MILNGCSAMFGGVSSMYTAPKSRYCYSAYSAHVPVKLACPTLRNSWKPNLEVKYPKLQSSWKPNQELKYYSSKGIQCPAISGGSSPVLKRDLYGWSHTITKIPMRRKKLVSPQASAKDGLTEFRYPTMTKKPRWWWRTLACLTYLMPLHQTWIFAETTYHLHPFLEDFESLTCPFLKVVNRLPYWQFMACFLLAYLGIVRRKEWPHFLRFHIVVGMLLYIALQVIGSTSHRFLPRGAYWGKVGMHCWTAFGFAFLFTVLECLRCCLAGMYADVPFLSDAAYMHIPYD